MSPQVVNNQTINNIIIQGDAHAPQFGDGNNQNYSSDDNVIEDLQDRLEKAEFNIEDLKEQLTNTFELFEGDLKQHIEKIDGELTILSNKRFANLRSAVSKKRVTSLPEQRRLCDRNPSKDAQIYNEDIFKKRFKILEEKLKELKKCVFERKLAVAPVKISHQQRSNDNNPPLSTLPASLNNTLSCDDPTYGNFGEIIQYGGKRAQPPTNTTDEIRRDGDRLATTDTRCKTLRNTAPPHTSDKTMVVLRPQSPIYTNIPKARHHSNHHVATAVPKGQTFSNSLSPDRNTFSYDNKTYGKLGTHTGDNNMVVRPKSPIYINIPKVQHHSHPNITTAVPTCQMLLNSAPADRNTSSYDNKTYGKLGTHTCDNSIVLRPESPIYINIPTTIHHSRNVATTVPKCQTLSNPAHPPCVVRYTEITLELYTAKEAYKGSIKVTSSITVEELQVKIRTKYGRDNVDICNIFSEQFGCVYSFGRNRSETLKRCRMQDGDQVQCFWE